MLPFCNLLYLSDSHSAIHILNCLVRRHKSVIMGPGLYQGGQAPPTPPSIGWGWEWVQYLVLDWPVCLTVATGTSIMGPTVKGSARALIRPESHSHTSMMSLTVL